MRQSFWASSQTKMNYKKLRLCRRFTNINYKNKGNKSS